MNSLIPAFVFSMINNYLMHRLVIALFLFLPSIVFSQESSLRSQTDSQVAHIDSTVSMAFHFNGTRPGNYTFGMSESRAVKIVHRFQRGIVDLVQTFYLRDTSLIFSKETETSYYLHGDTVYWSGMYYFKDGRLKDYETLGHGKSETEDWDPEKEVLENYSRARNAVLGYLEKRKQVPGNSNQSRKATR